MVMSNPSEDLSKLIDLNNDIQSNIENNLRNLRLIQKKDGSCFLNIRIYEKSGCIIKDGTPSTYDIRPDEWMPARTSV